MDENKSTAELINETRESSHPDEYFTKNTKEMDDMSLSGFFGKMLEKYDMKKSDLIRKAGLSGNNYAYEILRTDEKTPSRDIIIRLCLAFPLGIDETQLALRCAGKAPLYPRDRRDVCILFAIKNGLRPDELNEKLGEKGLKTLE